MLPAAGYPANPAEGRWVSDVAAQITPFGRGSDGQPDDQVAAHIGSVQCHWEE
jgi:hypothetical protein